MATSSGPVSALAQNSEAVQTPPQTLGYGFSVWSANRLAKHLQKTTKIVLGDDRLRAILAEEGFSFQRPKHTMKGKRDVRSPTPNAEQHSSCS